jgi:hypothetical protein
MAACLTDLTWRREAAKMVVLIADAPPHGQFSPLDLPNEGSKLISIGIGESGDRELIC